MPLREGDPESIGGYRIESRIGTGGMGVVYLGRSASGRAVAVKVVHTQYADDPEFRARFRQEVTAARRVSGAFTAPVVDADPEAALPWMATAYVPGDTLAQRVAEQGPLDWPRLKRLGGELAEALREIHRAEVVHRDLKPSNVLLLDSGEDTDGGGDGGDSGMTRVIDFGISRAAHSDVRTQTGLVMGSPPFMAPEQFSSPRDVGPPVDVFALGALLVYAATGRSPFEAENAYLAAYQTVHNDPELGALPESLRPLVLACLTKDPQDRPTPVQVLEALAALPDEGEAGAPPERASTVERAEDPASDATDASDASDATFALSATATAPQHPRRGRRFKVALAGAVALAAVIGIGVSVALLGGPDPVAQGTDGKSGLPDGWQPWQVVAEKDGDDMMPSSEACTPHAHGVYCASPTTALTRLDPLTGKVKWTKPMHRPKSSNGYSVTDPVVGAGAVFTFSAEGSQGVDAYDTKSGRRLWRLPGPHAEFQFLSGVLVVHKGELSESRTSTYTAYDPRSGDELWHHKVTSDSAGAFYAGPDGTVFADLRTAARKGDPAPASSAITRFDARTGRKLGSVKAPKGDLWLATVHDGKGYFARWEDDSGVASRFFIQDLTSGDVRGIDFPWAVEPEAPPLVRGDAMYLFDYANETVLALDLKRGKPLWTTSRDLRIFSEPSVRGDTLYATMPDSSVIAVNTRTGKERWRSAPSFKDTDRGGSVDDRSPSGVAPLALGGVLYGVTDDGTFSVAAKG